MYANYWGNLPGYSSYSWMHNSLFGLFLAPVVIWALFWKGWALWTAAREGSKPWFVALMLINTVGILEIIYIFFVAKKSKEVKHSGKKK